MDWQWWFGAVEIPFLRAGKNYFLCERIFARNVEFETWDGQLKQLKLRVSGELSAISKFDETFISSSVNMPIVSYTKKGGKL